MKKIIIALLLLTVNGLCAQSKSEQLRHVVIFKFKASSAQASVDSVVNSFMSLAKKIPVVKSMEWGLNDSPENFHQGFTHCFVLTFANKKDRDEVYQKHPAHLEFQKVLGPHMEKVFVVDYQVEK
ncbi:MAG: Dabb family protein [Chitinophagaceae bacterium]